METKTLPPNSVVLRPYRAEDESFIYSSWLKSYRDSRVASPVDNRTYFEGQHRVIENILKRATISIACSASDPSQIFGYIVSEATPEVRIIHWVYCKLPFRGFGIAKLLEDAFLATSAAPVIYTHVSKNSGTILSKRNYTYNPYLVWTKE